MAGDPVVLGFLSELRQLLVVAWDERYDDSEADLDRALDIIDRLERIANSPNS